MVIEVRTLSAFLHNAVEITNVVFTTTAAKDVQITPEGAIEVRYYVVVSTFYPITPKKYIPMVYTQYVGNHRPHSHPDSYKVALLGRVQDYLNGVNKEITEAGFILREGFITLKTHCHAS